MKRSLCLILLAAATAAFFQGCATTEDSDRERVSDLPWNRPQSWEGSGMLGGMAPQ